MSDISGGTPTMLYVPRYFWVEKHRIVRISPWFIFRTEGFYCKFTAECASENNSGDQSTINIIRDKNFLAFFSFFAQLHHSKYIGIC